MTEKEAANVIMCIRSYESRFKGSTFLLGKSSCRSCRWCSTTSALWRCISPLNSCSAIVEALELLGASNEVKQDGDE